MPRFDFRFLRAALTASALLAAPAIASAESIVYVDGGNIWSARPDGSARVQLTDGGDWHDPTQADDGTIAAVEGLDTIHVLTREGRPLHTMTTPYGVRSGDGGTFSNRPVDLALSPDGRRLAYSYLAYSCPPGSTCGTIQRATFFTETDRTVASDTYAPVLGVNAPSWVSNNRVMTFGGYLRNVNFYDLGATGPGRETTWFSNEADTKDGELSPDHRFLALDLFYGSETEVGVVPVDGDPATIVPRKPSVVLCSFGPDAKLKGATWAPDSKGLAFSSQYGIEVARFASFNQDGCSFAADPAVFSTTGSQPDWGPADPPAARWSGERNSISPSPESPPEPAPTPKWRTDDAPLAVTLGGPARLKLRGTRIRVPCQAPEAQFCRLLLEVKLARRVVRARASGRPGPLSLRLARRDAVQLAAALRSGSARATVTASVTSGGRTGVATRRFTLYR